MCKLLKNDKCRKISSVCASLIILHRFIIVLIYYSLEGGAWETYSEPITFDANQTVSFKGNLADAGFRIFSSLFMRDYFVSFFVGPSRPLPTRIYVLL